MLHISLSREELKKNNEQARAELCRAQSSLSLATRQLKLKLAEDTQQPTSFWIAQAASYAQYAHLYSETTFLGGQIGWWWRFVLILKLSHHSLARVGDGTELVNLTPNINPLYTVAYLYTFDIYHSYIYLLESNIGVFRNIFLSIYNGVWRCRH